MSIDSHIEDAMKHLGKKYGGDGPDSRDIFRSVIGSAIAEATAPLKEEAAWIRKKLGLPDDCGTFVLGGVAGEMHVLCSDAHAYKAYIAAYKCDDKQGEIARLTREVSTLRQRIAELEGLWPLIEDYIAEVNRLFYIEDQSGEMIDLSLKINAILKGGAK